MDAKLFFGVWSLHLIALISPGPDFILTLKNTLHFGKKAGMLGSIGFGCGILIHCFLSIFGIYLLLEKFPVIQSFLYYLGGSYLIWVGSLSLFKTLKSPPDNSSELLTQQNPFNQMGTFLQSLLTNLLNPKAGIFILSIFSGVSHQSITLTDQLILSFGFFALTILWFSLVAIFIDNKTVKSQYLKLEKKINLVFATVFLIFGFLLIFY